MNEILVRLNLYYLKFLSALPRIGMAIIILVVGILLASWLTKIIQKGIRKRSHDPLMSSFLGEAIKLIFVVVIILFSLSVAGLGGIAGALLATAGASAVVLGFAFKDIAENFLAGIILAFNRPFRVNDTVQIENVFGKIKEMEFRYTKIVTFDGRSVYIPNSDVLTKPVFNYTEDGFYRSDFVVGIAYENEIENAKEIIRECFDLEDKVINTEEHVSFVVEDELATSTVNLKVFFWVETLDFRRNMLEIRGSLIKRVKMALEDAGFNLPADIQEIKFYDGSRPLQFENYLDQKKQPPLESGR